MAEEWDDGLALLAAVASAITEERVKAHAKGRVATSADMARAVLRSPALQDANRKILDDMMTGYEPKVAVLVAAEAVLIAEALIAAEREAIAGALHRLAMADLDGVPGVERSAYRDAYLAAEQVARVGGQLHERSDDKEGPNP